MKLKVLLKYLFPKDGFLIVLIMMVNVQLLIFLASLVIISYVANIMTDG